MARKQPTKELPIRAGNHGLGQLSLVEHALCPLDSKRTFNKPFTHRASYRLTASSGERRVAQVRVHCPEGLSATDEFYLWGLLALTFSQDEPQAELYATPHYCLCQLGLIRGTSKGGRNYQLFRDALRRLSAIRYQNDHFYDPIRCEHRDVSFGFLGYSLPTDPKSSRAWRIVWDPIFFEYCQAIGGRFRFDWLTYEQLEPAPRRLYLILHKIFWRRVSSPVFDLRHLAIEILGFSSTLPTRSIKEKLKRCTSELVAHGIVDTRGQPIDSLFSKLAKGRYSVQFHRGRHFDRTKRVTSLGNSASPLRDPLRTIGFEDLEVDQLLGRFESDQIRLWSDVTLAAVEHKEASFFRKNPQAFFLNNISAAKQGGRTPPDWFLDIKKHEENEFTRPRQENRKSSEAAVPKRAIENSPKDESFLTEMLENFMAAGQDKKVAARNARRLIK